jgi:DNA-binding response OmpR family regulator
MLAGQSPHMTQAYSLSNPEKGAVASDVGSESSRAIILVVERDPHVRDLEAYFLNEAGYVVEFAADGVGALAMARALIPRIVVTEILVPKLDGLSLCRAIKEDPALADTAVLIFSILAAAARARDAGADAFLMKPLADRRLVDTVRALIAKRHGGSARPPYGPSRPGAPQS